jgi:Lrp/AsnC family transcriptional regulator for asnA, asnC and gidA
MITIGAIPDPTAMGLEVQADVMIEVEPGMVESVAVALSDYHEVGYLATITGRFNLLAAISVASQADLLDFCDNVVG